MKAGRLIKLIICWSSLAQYDNDIPLFVKNECISRNPSVWSDYSFVEVGTLDNDIPHYSQSSVWNNPSYHFLKHPHNVLTIKFHHFSIVWWSSRVCCSGPLWPTRSHPTHVRVSSIFATSPTRLVSFCFFPSHKYSSDAKAVTWPTVRWNRY